MASLFLSFWNRSIAAGWLILAVVLLRLLLRKAPKPARCLLWLLVGLRLVWPFSIESVLSLIPSAETIPQAVLVDSPFQISSGIYALNSTVNEYLRTGQDMNHPSPALSVQAANGFFTICGWAWVLGMVLLAIWALAGWLKLRRRVAEAVPEEDGAWLCEGIASPFLLGLLRPRIYLPMGLEPEARGFILAHEEAHIRRRDHWTKLLAFLILTAYWFHPLVWLAYILLCRDIELACDEQVVQVLGPEGKRAYSQALLQCSVRGNTIAACPLAFGEVGVKERVKNVLNYKKPAFWVAAASLLVILTAAVCFLTDPVSPPPGTPDRAPDVSNLNAAGMEPAPRAGLIDGPPVYTGGAILYQHMALSSYFSDAGSWYASVIEEGDALRIIDGEGNTTRYVLEDTSQFKPEDFYQFADAFADLAVQEERMGRRLIPEEAESITRRNYISEEPNADGKHIREYIWEMTLADGGKRMWIGGEWRLFALIDLRESFFPMVVFGVLDSLWTYDPSCPSAIPVRFDLPEGANVWTASGQLGLDPKGDVWTGGPLTVEPGQTVYWKPFGKGAPTEGASLRYSYPPEDSGKGRNSDSVSLRSLMDYEGLYGGKTYGISQEWLGVLSSRFHENNLHVDRETGELVVCAYAALDKETQDSAGVSESGAAIRGAPLQDFVTWDAQAEE